jgi:hypothetical protein
MALEEKNTTGILLVCTQATKTRKNRKSITYVTYFTRDRIGSPFVSLKPAI